MHALVKGALAAAALSVIGTVTAVRAPPVVTAALPRVASSSPPGSPVAALTQMPCPPRELPEGDACTPVPPLGAPDRADSDRGEMQRERRTRRSTVEIIPRKPDRPVDASAFAFPLKGDEAPLFLRGFDDTLPAADGPFEASPVSLEIVAARGAPVSTLMLDGQAGPTTVAATGRAIGTTLVTAHIVRAEGRERTILLVYGHLDALAPDLAVGRDLAPGDVLGFVGDSGNPGIVSLYLEARLVLDDASIAGLELGALLQPSFSVPVDARNVLPQI
jgi:hypothetical protein